MRLLLFSDSHGNTYNIYNAINHHADADMVIHLGDYAGDILKIREDYGHIKFEFVGGNNDFTSAALREKVLELCGKKILITHGHLYNVKSGYDRIISKGESIGADAVFFGHTHVNEELYCGGMLLLNPGSIGAYPYSENPTYCLVEIINDKFRTRFFSVNAR